MQDGNPSQNSALARSAWQEIGAQLMSLPPRSGDIHCIESIFHIVKNNLRDDALKNNITYETFPNFCKRVEDTIRSLDKKIIDKMIETIQENRVSYSKKRTANQILNALNASVDHIFESLKSAVSRVTL